MVDDYCRSRAGCGAAVSRHLTPDPRPGWKKILPDVACTSSDAQHHSPVTSCGAGICCCKGAPRHLMPSAPIACEHIFFVLVDPTVIASDVNEQVAQGCRCGSMGREPSPRHFGINRYEAVSPKNTGKYMASKAPNEKVQFLLAEEEVSKLLSLRVRMCQFVLVLESIHSTHSRLEC